MSASKGIYGLEARHAFDGLVVLNDLAAHPHVRLRAINGLHALAEMDDSRIAATARQGEIPLTAFRRGKTITYEGQVRATDLAMLRRYSADVLAAFATTDEKQMVITPDPAYGADSFFYWARPTLCDIPDQVGSPMNREQGHKRPFALALRLSDGRIYDGQLVSMTTGAVSALAGTPPPFQPPVELAAPSGTRSEGTVTNTGTADSDPVIDFYGPVWNPVIENTTIGRSLTFGNLFVAGGTFIRVDFRDRTILLSGEDDISIKLDVLASDWWDAGVPGIIPGLNTIRLRGTQQQAGSHADVSFYPAYK